MDKYADEGTWGLNTVTTVLSEDLCRSCSSFTKTDVCRAFVGYGSPFPSTRLTMQVFQYAVESTR